MIETYRMLGREREADLERDAERARRAALLPRKHGLGLGRRIRLGWLGRFRAAEIDGATPTPGTTTADRG